MVQITNIQPKARKGSVTGSAASDSGTVYNADIIPGTSIRIYGTHQKTPFDITFKVGDTAEYDSWNTHYVGQIKQITVNSVTIDRKNTGEGNKRLSLYEFSWRNYNFNEEKISKRNHETSLSI